MNYLNPILNFSYYKIYFSCCHIAGDTSETQPQIKCGENETPFPCAFPVGCQPHCPNTKPFFCSPRGVRNFN